MRFDFIPGPDGDFDAWVGRFVQYSLDHAEELELSDEEVGGLSSLQDAWHGQYRDFLKAQTALRAALQAKDTGRAAMEALARAVAGQLQARPATTDPQRAELGLTVPKAGASKAAVPDTLPVIQRIDRSVRTVLRLFYADSATLTRVAKPAGVRFVEIRQQLGGEAPVDPEGMRLLGMSSRVPYRVEFGVESVGQPVFFALRWVNTRGEPGPWSQIYQTVVPA